MKIDKIYCRKCQKTKSSGSFYESGSILDSNGYMSVCKDCCGDIYNQYFSIFGNIDEALYKTCQLLDVCFSNEAISATKSQMEKLLAGGKKTEAIFGYYKSKLSSIVKKNIGEERVGFNQSDIFISKEFKDKEESEINISIDDTVKKYWGKGKQNWEYEFLEDEITKIKTSFECDDYSMEMLMKDIAFINLEIEKTRQGAKGDVTKLIETRSKLMTDANLKPVQATGADANDQLSFGTLIKKWENEQPIPTVLDDEMKKYINTYMVGHLAKIMGLNNEAVSAYEEAIKEYTIDFENRDNEVEDDE